MNNGLNKAAGALGRVVLLGARGFIGAAINRRLRAVRVPVLELSSRELDLAAPGAADKAASLLKPDDSVVMLAALTPDKGRGAAAMLRNLTMMQQFCEVLAKTGCKHLVYFSSDAVYGLGPALVTEETPAAPQDLYGVMHRAREIMASEMAGVPVLVLRPTLVYGVDDTHNAYGPNGFRRAAQKDGRIQLFGNGEETRDHIHVDDVAELTYRCLLRCLAGTLNIATGTSKSFYQVAELVAKQYDHVIEIVCARRTNPVTHRHYDVKNLVKEFPDFRFTTLADGVAQCHREMKGRN